MFLFFLISIQWTLSIRIKIPQFGVWGAKNNDKFKYRIKQINSLK
jgi:hypothetical protein